MQDTQFSYVGQGSFTHFKFDHHRYLHSINLALNGDHSPSLHKPSPYNFFHNKNIKLGLSWHKFEYTQVFKKKNQNTNMKEWEEWA